MPIMDVAGFQTLLDRRYAKILDMELASIVDQIPLWFSVETSSSFEERRGTIGELPVWDVFQGNVEYARFYEQYNATATHIEFTQGLRWPRRMMDDDLTGIMRGDHYRKMVRSAIISRQIHAARLWNYMASNDSYFYSRSEGVPMASASHTTRADGVSTTSGFNNITVAELSPTAYRALRQQMRRFANDRGHIMNIVGDTLVVPIELEQRAMEIQDSPGDADTARRSSNPEARTAGIEVPLYWTSTQNWAIVNKAMLKENAVWFDHTKPDFENSVDRETFQVKATGYMRYSYLLMDWRGVAFGNVA